MDSIAHSCSINTRRLVNHLRNVLTVTAVPVSSPLCSNSELAAARSDSAVSDLSVCSFFVAVCCWCLSCTTEHSKYITVKILNNNKYITVSY